MKVSQAFRQGSDQKKAHAPCRRAVPCRRDPDLPKLQLQLRELKLEDIRAGDRPQPKPIIVYLFSDMLCDFNGDCKDQHARLLLQEQNVRLSNVQA